MKTDPTRLTGLRRRTRSKIRERLSALKLELARHIVRDEGLSGTDSPAQKIESFLEWWDDLTERELLNGWWEPFLSEAVGRGLLDSYRKVRGNPLAGWDSGFREFLYGLGKRYGNYPVGNARRNTPQVRDVRGKFISERVKELSVQLKQDLRGLSTALAQRMARVLAKGIDQGWDSKKLARELVREIDGLGKVRANAIATTELTRAYASSQLDAFRELGETEVGVRAEWSTSDNPCSLCEPLDGVVMTIEEAEGLIPRHINCMCGWDLVPAGTKKLPGQKTGKREKERAVQKSVKAGGKNEGTASHRWSP